jgi:hypothetical protein
MTNLVLAMMAEWSNALDLSTWKRRYFGFWNRKQEACTLCKCLVLQPLAGEERNFGAPRQPFFFVES